MSVLWSWVGGVTTTAAVVKVRTEGGEVALRYGATLEMLSTSQESPAVDGMGTVALSGLTANTLYHYVPVVDGSPDWSKRGKFRTFPSGAASFTFAFGSCAGGGTTYPVAATDPTGATGHSNHMVFDAIRATSPALFLHLGDLHYEDSTSTDNAEWRSIYDRALANSRQAALLSEVPTVYTYDNHDYYSVAPIGAGAGAARSAVRSVYRERVPSYTLPAGTGNQPIYQAFTCGRVRFLVTDTISERSPFNATDNASKSFLGATQKQWLKDEMLAATEPAICWVMPAAPWVGGGPEDIANDRWGVYTTERTELADFITTNNLTSRVFIISADAHMMTYDDGTNAPGGVKVLQAAPFDRGGSTLGGPYSQGTPVTLRGSYGHVAITDTGGATIGVSFTGRRVRTQDSQGTSALVGPYAFTVGPA